jgi:hypothetical protein
MKHYMERKRDVKRLAVMPKVYFVVERKYSVRIRSMPWSYVNKALGSIGTRIQRWRKQNY